MKINTRQINGDRIILRYPEIKDAGEFIRASKKSKAFHQGLVKPARNLEEFREFIKRNESESNECFLICKKNQTLIGAINISQIFYGGFKNAYLGYYLFRDFTGNGFMREALLLTLKFSFQILKLHRLEANIQPQNQASVNLVKKCGFNKEGFSPKYLKIGGKWRDHERWALIKENWKKT
jgi:ribosomal-protein-alanine N-acetyltransferase